MMVVSWLQGCKLVGPIKGYTWHRACIHAGRIISKEELYAIQGQENESGFNSRCMIKWKSKRSWNNTSFIK